MKITFHKSPTTPSPSMRMREAQRLQQRRKSSLQPRQKPRSKQTPSRAKATDSADGQNQTLQHMCIMMTAKAQLLPKTSRCTQFGAKSERSHSRSMQMTARKQKRQARRALNLSHTETKQNLLQVRSRAMATHFWAGELIHHQHMFHTMTQPHTKSPFQALPSTFTQSGFQKVQP